MTKHTSFKIGGPAEVFIKATSLDEIKSVKEVLELLKKRVKNHKRKKDYDKVIKEAEEEIKKVL